MGNTIGDIASTTRTNTSTYNLYIMADNYSPTGTVLYASLKLYSFSIYEKGKQVAYFVPCYRKEDGVIGLYNTVDKQFYTNGGTGTFGKGNDV